MYKLFSAEACPYVGARVSLPQLSAYIIAYAIYAICIFCNLLLQRMLFSWSFAYNCKKVGLIYFVFGV